MNPATNVSPSAELSIPIVIAPGNPPRALDVHPAAALFPLMKGPEFGLLVEDIDEHGLREPILMYQGLVLDGRNRLRACEIAGVEPRFVEWDGAGSPLAFVLSRNLYRRHLNEGQRALIAARAKGMFEDEAAERKRASQFGQSPQSPAEEGGGREKPREITAGANLRQPMRGQVRSFATSCASSNKRGGFEWPSCASSLALGGFWDPSRRDACTTRPGGAFALLRRISAF